MLAVVIASKERPENWNTYVKWSADVDGQIAELGKAVEQGENSKIAEVIQDGLAPVFSSLKEVIRESIDTEGVRVNLN